MSTVAEYCSFLSLHKYKLVGCLSLTFRSCIFGVNTGNRQASNGHQNGGLVFSSSSTHTQPGKFSSPTQTVISLARGAILSLKLKAFIHTRKLIHENNKWKIHVNNVLLMFEIPHLLRAILARCRRLTQEILLIGLGVLKTTVKLTGRPDLSRDIRTHTSTNCENPRGIQHNQNSSETKLLSVPRMTKISMYSSICAKSQNNLCLLEKSTWQQQKTQFSLMQGSSTGGSTMVRQGAANYCLISK